MSGADLPTAQQILSRLGFPKQQTNDRSGWVLLALLGLKPGDPWSEATNEMFTTRPIMDRIRDDWGKDYAPNSRETIRRQTLHQFVDAGLVDYNADDPYRAVNSSKNNYRINQLALELIQAWDQPGNDQRLKDYLAARPGLITRYNATREMNRIPVTLPGGKEVTLSPGGQNVLIKAMVEEFCPRYTPGGEVIYIGDADGKATHFDVDGLGRLGVQVDKHGKMPDLVVYRRSKNWLFLMEAASTHGPVDGKRYEELRKLFKGCTAGLVYVSCFPDRAVMRAYLSDLAWETEAWCADTPDHMIHLNGDKFLGPHN
ncbi:BsuBI/PstI family type II restriction endonuclease [Nocardiopsis sp. N85]|uniref:BsuBI/PstI family type II restriction endonuclease n=1 Tax=Nocardiopsis sp. N85 TaxID=3029400 RepID=UPI00237FB837|nr:BsuBI/PstI family type II restriction endonuclease [Nocardiopsis sp. N85]MDE3721415.1 BsuBI/PstI family type II restriction endonuclease [Nocardiopsis sp. N85]